MGAEIDGMRFSGVSYCHQHKEAGAGFPGKVEHVGLLFIVCDGGMVTKD